MDDRSKSGVGKSILQSYNPRLPSVSLTCHKAECQANFIAANSRNSGGGGGGDRKAEEPGTWQWRRGKLVDKRNLNKCLLFLGFIFVFVFLQARDMNKGSVMLCTPRHIFKYTRIRIFSRVTAMDEGL